MEITSQTIIQNRYEIRSLIDKGGMGEVYLAQDTKLGRQVALKLLKKTDDESRIKRFRQEARVVSALNHPNILTIYDFGQFEDFHFIISELVKGKTLRKLINYKTLPLIEILDIGIQIGNALIATHSEGIIHRDIKPENIMILPDGHVKVLDFGLAKLTSENKLEQDPSETTASVFHSNNRVVAGTVHYMSPEQLRGQPIDERSDIWSLGVVLYELITNQRPFKGNNNSDIIVSVLEHQFPLISADMSKSSIEIENLFIKALAKKKEDRFRTARDFVDNLKAARFGIESSFVLTVTLSEEQINTNKTELIISTNALQNNTNQSRNLETSFSKNLKNLWLYLSAVILISALGIVAYLFFNNRTASQSNEKQLKLKRLPTAGNIINGVISSDGRFIAFVQNDKGKQSLWLRQANEAVGKELISPALVNYSGISFSPDGNSIFYTLFADKASGVLYKIPLLGGSPQEIIKDIDSAVSFSPNGSHFAFIRSKSSQGIDQIIVSDASGSEQKVLSEKKRPEFYSISTREGLSWSPDGKSIACPVGRKDSLKEFMQLAEIDISNGTEKIISKNEWFRIGKIVWAKNNELLITATESSSSPFQIVKVFYETGETKKLTQDLSDYFNLSVTNDFDRLLGIAFDKYSNIFTSFDGNIDQSRMASGGGFDGLGGLSWTPNGKIVFASVQSGNYDIWRMDVTGDNRQQLTFDLSSDEYPDVSKNGRYIVFVSSRDGTPHIWRMNADGGSLKQLTYQADEAFPRITPDGNWVIYSARTDGRWALWKVSIDGGETFRLADEQTHWAAISPDGKTVACLGRENIPDAPIKLVLISLEQGKVLNRFNIIDGAVAPDIVPILRWSVNNDAITYVATQNGVSNIYWQPVKGGEPNKITDFAVDRIFSFDWSENGKNIIFARGVIRNDLILIEDF